MLRACTHPYLLDAPRDENGQMIVNEDLISQSGKFILLDKMLGKLRQKGHKVLIFSTLVIFLDLLESMCEHRKYGYTRLDGSTTFEDRIEAVTFSAVFHRQNVFVVFFRSQILTKIQKRLFF